MSAFSSNAAHADEAGFLLEHLGWIRRLARHLVSDAAEAEDLVQDTCLVLLQRRPEDGRKIRRWLASVMRNLRRERARGAGRRSVREEAVARPEESASTAELVEQVATQRQLVEAVLELPEPYRSVVILRYFQDLPPREIAKRFGVPATTVQSQLKRALAKLRARLDRAHGECRAAWMALVLPLAQRLDPLSAPTLGGLVMNTKLVVASGLLVAIAGTAAAVYQRGAPELTAPALAGKAAVAEPDAPVGGPEAAPEPRPVERAERAAAPVVPAAAPDPASAAAPEVATFSVVGRVLTADGEPVPGVALARADAPATGVLATSEGNGWFELTTADTRLALVAADPAWVTVREAAWERDASYAPVLVIAPAIELAGAVRDAHGIGLAGALVRVGLPADFEARLGQVLDATRTRSWTATSGPDGAFRLPAVPGVVGSSLRATLDGYRAETLPVAPRSDHGLSFVLRRPETPPPEGALAGRVVDERGDPARGARVALGLASLAVDDDGAFVIPLARAVTAERLTAVQEGYLPAVLERPGAPESERGGWPEFVELRLDARALAVSGLVVDHEGDPVAGARLWISDPTPAGTVGQMPVFAEHLMAGATVPPQAVESEAALGPRDGDNYTDWTTSPGPPTAFWSWVTTDGEGRFDLPGLAARDYRFTVMPKGGLDVHELEPVAAGANGVVLRLPRPERLEKVAGRVVSDDGRPVAGVRITAFVRAVDAHGRYFGGRTRISIIENGGRATTDADGGFALADLPAERTELALSSDGIVPTSLELDGAGDPNALRILVHARCHVQIELEDPELADGFGFADGEGGRLDVNVLTSGSHNAYTDYPIQDGRSGVVSVSSAARELRLLKDGALVTTLPIRLQSGELNVLRP